jgi:mannose-6-phosphate isomerase-like protein (cupin superfamily)
MSQSENVTRHLWGMEITWSKQKDYQGKILVFEKAGYVTDMHFHKQTDKSWFINSGSAKVTWIDTSTGNIFEKDLSEGATFDIPALTPVKLEALADGTSVSEVNNQSDTNDYFIVVKTMQVKEDAA